MSKRSLIDLSPGFRRDLEKLMALADRDIRGTKLSPKDQRGLWEFQAAFRRLLVATEDSREFDLDLATVAAASVILRGAQRQSPSAAPTKKPLTAEARKHKEKITQLAKERARLEAEIPKARKAYEDYVETRTARDVVSMRHRVMSPEEHHRSAELLRAVRSIERSRNAVVLGMCAAAKQ